MRIDNRRPHDRKRAAKFVGTDVVGGKYQLDPTSGRGSQSAQALLPHGVENFAVLRLHLQRLPPGHFAGQWAAGEGDSHFDFVYGHCGGHPNWARTEAASVERGGRSVQGDAARFGQDEVGDHVPAVIG